MLGSAKNSLRAPLKNQYFQSKFVPRCPQVRWILPNYMNPRALFASLLRESNYPHSTRNPASLFLQTLTNPTSAMSTLTTIDGDPDDILCATDTTLSDTSEAVPPPPMDTPSRVLNGVTRVERAWAHWRALGAPRFVVAPMVDNSELPFRMLCRKYGAEAAYTPMLHSRIFSENEKYRSMEFSTCKEDRPLFVQFCANDPKILLEAARRVEPCCDYIDINLGCPQRIARRGYYGAFLMENQPLIKSLVETLALNLDVPVSCKVRIFPNLDDTISYAKMLEEAGCSLLAVHGRTRDQKDSTKFKADWAAIRAVKQALRIPVLANGNIRRMADVNSCLEETGTDGVLSAETLLENPALFAGYKTVKWREEGDEEGGLDQGDLVVEYLRLCEKYPVPWRMVRSHVHKLLGDWFRVHPEVREELNKQSTLTFEWLYDMVRRLKELGVQIPLYGGIKVAVDKIAVNGAAG